MLNITFAAADEALAERIRADLAAMPLRLEHRILIVLASQESLADESVRRAIKEAEKAGMRLAVLRVRPVDVPGGMGEFAPLDLTNGYDARRVVAYVNRVDLGMARIRRGQRLLFFVGAAAIIMFFAAIWGIASGNVRFPIEEYATELAVELNQIATFVAPTLDYLMPRTTADALNHMATVEMIPTRVLIFALQTATAIPLGISATQEAIATAAQATSIALTLTPQATPTLRATMTPGN